MTLAALSLGAVAGCGLHDPYAHERSGSLLPPKVPLPSAVRPGRGATSAQTRASPTSGSTTSARSSTPSGRAAPTTVELLPNTTAGSPNSARFVMQQFALAYGNVSAAGLGARARTLSLLCTPTLARSFGQGQRAPDQQVLHGLPTGSQMVARVMSIQLRPAQANHRDGIVVLEEALRQHDGSTEQPFQTMLSLTAAKIGSQWRIAVINPQS
jgi:hypothetical protein